MAERPPEAAPDGAAFEVMVVYALPRRAFSATARVVPGTTVDAAVAASGLLLQVPELRDQPLELGIFGRPCTLQQVVHAGDRIEIYRPLQTDPKEARRQRAAARGTEEGP